MENGKLYNIYHYGLDFAAVLCCGVKFFLEVVVCRV